MNALNDAPKSEVGSMSVVVRMHMNGTVHGTCTELCNGGVHPFASVLLSCYIWCLSLLAGSQLAVKVEVVT
eukprot:5070273-Amphidinium_carterae.1